MCDNSHLSLSEMRCLKAFSKRKVSYALCKYNRGKVLYPLSLQKSGVPDHLRFSKSSLRLSFLSGCHDTLCRYIPMSSALCQAPKHPIKCSRSKFKAQQLMASLIARNFYSNGVIENDSVGKAKTSDTMSASLEVQTEASSSPILANHKFSDCNSDHASRAMNRAEVVRIEVIFPPDKYPTKEGCMAFAQPQKGHIEFLESEELAHRLLYAVVLPSFWAL
jgi:hypothetical protein